MGEATTKRLQNKLSKSNANKKLNAKKPKMKENNLRRSSRLKDSDKDSKDCEEIPDIEGDDLQENTMEYSEVEEDCEELQNSQELEEHDIYEDSEKFEEDEYIPENMDNSEYDPLNLDISTNFKESNETKSEKPKKPRMKFPKWDEFTDLNEDGTERICKICGKVVKVKKHYFTHTQEKPYKCNFEGCSRSFAVKEYLEDHFLSHSDFKISCEICNQSFKSNRTFKAHRALHDKKSYKHKCRKCSSRFRTITDLKGHENNHKPNETLVKCVHCGNTYISTQMLRTHMNVEHGIETRYRHLNKKSQTKKRPKFEENQKVSELFKAQKLSEEHYKIASEQIDRFADENGILKYKCKVCDKELSHYKLMLHVLAKHTNEKPFKCTFEECTKTFTNPDYFRTHLRQHFGEDDSFECEICKALFKFKAGLRKHQAMYHEKDKFLKCTFCSATFYSKSDFNKHEARHKPFETLLPCELCDKFYLTKCLLVNHKFAEHGILPDRIKLLEQEPDLNNFEEKQDFEEEEEEEVEQDLEFLS